LTLLTLPATHIREVDDPPGERRNLPFAILVEHPVVLEIVI
jgi:hypothetical protein